MADQADTRWRVVARRLVVDHAPYVRLIEEDLQLPDGQIITNFARIELPNFTIVFAVLGDGPGTLRVPFVRQYRHAVGGPTLELPAGNIDAGEQPLEAAVRELREEAGAEAAHWRLLGKYVMDANHDCGWAHVYLAQGARLAVTPDSGDLGEMTVELLALNEVRELWLAGEFVSAPTSLAVGLALAALDR